MPEFIVRFSQPVDYLKGHPRQQLGITHLIVSAPNESGAMIHAVRVVSGEPGDITIAPFERIPDLPAVEVNNDPT